jgi:hypothetical protein
LAVAIAALSAMNIVAPVGATVTPNETTPASKAMGSSGQIGGED